jgi:hypothetical protein
MEQHQIREMSLLSGATGGIIATWILIGIILVAVEPALNLPTGFIPAVYDKGTHYVTNMRLTLDILKTLNDFDFVLEVTGDYTGTLTGRGASHEPSGGHTH